MDLNDEYKFMRSALQLSGVTDNPELQSLFRFIRAHVLDTFDAAEVEFHEDTAVLMLTLSMSLPGMVESLDDPETPLLHDLLSDVLQAADGSAEMVYLMALTGAEQ